MGKYAILYAGGINEVGLNMRYKNDLEYMYSVLKSKLGYEESNIHILLGDGECFDKKEDVLAGTFTNLKTILNKHSDLKEYDQLLIMISNHGGPLNKNKDMGICGYMPVEKKHIFFEEFKCMLEKIKCKKIIVMGQCYGGDFLQFQLENSIILTANEPGKCSYARIEDLTDLTDLPSKLKYDEFLYQFISYFNGQYSDGKSLLKLSCKYDKSISDAYLYSREADMYRDGVKLGDDELIEIPQMAEFGLDGKLLFL